ncbi:cobalt-zinc-cadmium resistance protein CzcA [Geminocystis sp. NIES-3708]|uniref:efflux RND transporter permease subunit n=1 Tax=Geminocystis sp. NIES-3708 TaxID=1615909 RepID=UPI0005FC7AB9|nr:efflux RND transporter permease subunit [Geminocystis sp. NIES-3708]BAQ60082.1 cobalt-zinc-cadmium resistance protein CzcA [Geminocystis sp. NIES-3708]
MKLPFTPLSSRFSISGLSIRRHIATIMLTLAVMIIGIFFVTTIQVDLLPSITYPRIGVRVDTEGIVPEIAVEEITRPLEEAFSATEGVELVYSQTRENSISLDLFFRVGGNIDQALNDATASFNRARSRLPDDIESPRIFKFEPSQLPVYEFAITSEVRDILDLRVFANQELARELTVVPGVASVDISGGIEEEVRVEIDLQRLQALGIGLNDVLAEIRDTNQDIAGGRLLGENNEPLTRVVGRFKSAEELNNLSFAIPNSSQRVYLNDFANVIDGAQDQRIFVYLNGTPAVKVSMQKQPEANTIEVVESIKAKIEELKKANTIPDDLTLLPTLDESIFIRNAINNVISSGLIGTGLAAIAVLLFLGSIRQTIIIVISIPMATLAAVIMMKIFGLSLNVFSLGGLALGVGIVVDNSIVMLETIIEGTEKIIHDPISDKGIYRRQILEQSIQSSSEVESALVASTSTNLVAVLPFLMIGGFISLLFNELVLTISFAVGASIVVAVTVVPMLTSRLLAIQFSSQIRRFFIISWFNKAFNAANNSYSFVLSLLIKIRWFFVLGLFILLGSTSLNFAQQLPQEILPQINTGQASVFVQFPPNTILENNQKVMELVDGIILKQPETLYSFTTSGGSLFASNVNENALRGSSTITVKKGTNLDEYITKLNKAFNQLNLVDTRIRVNPAAVRGLFLNNSPVRADVDVILQGNDQGLLEDTGRKIVGILDEKAKLVQFRPDADPAQPEVAIIPDLQRLADLNLSIIDITDSLQTTVSGLVTSQLQRGERLIDIRVQLDQNLVKDANALLEVPIFTNDNRLIRLGDVATISTEKAPSQIQRINQRQVFIITGNLAEGASLGPGLAEVNSILETIELPQGIRILPSIAAESNKQLQASLPILGSLAAFLVFVVMAVQYNSIIDPLVIMFTLPLALSGGIIGLYVTQTPIGATVIVGAVLLIGIVVNNAIIMVELANQIYDKQLQNPHIEKPSRYTAILQASSQRLRPILMTTITTVLGMFPLALGAGEGGEFLQPLGIVVFSGLSLATLLTLFLIPCLYLLLHQPLTFSTEEVTFIEKKNISQSYTYLGSTSEKQ